MTTWIAFAASTPSKPEDEMDTTHITRSLRNALASLIGYPPVMQSMLTRRLEG